MELQADYKVEVETGYFTDREHENWEQTTKEVKENPNWDKVDAIEQAQTIVEAYKMLNYHEDEDYDKESFGWVVLTKMTNGQTHQTLVRIVETRTILPTA